MKKPLVGFIEQGYIGKNYADDFEERGYTVIRYARRPPYAGNEKKIAECDIVFIAVPTPTTPEGFDASSVQSAVSLVGEGKTVVIKSTILPGTTEKIQKDHPDKTILFSPEFLLETTAARDAAHPIFNIVGIADDSAVYRSAAEELLKMLPSSPHSRICSSREAELFKYVHNIHAVFRIIFTNIVYDLSTQISCNWENIEEMMRLDPYMNENASYYNHPVHKNGRGAGGHCFIKDFSAFERLYKELTGDKLGHKVLEAVEAKNLELLRKSNKDLDLLEGVYGKSRRSRR